MLQRLSIVLATLCGTAAHAHQIWIEQPAGRPAIVRFGEFGENLRETSPGLLDKFGKPEGVRVSARGEAHLAATRVADGFQLAGRAGPSDSLVAEDRAYPLYTSGEGDAASRNWYWPAARFVNGPAARAPRLTLDIVPTGQAGEFKVTHRGAPLARAKVGIVVPSGWGREAVTDAQGVVRFSLPWRGTYVLEVGHTDATPGERDGAAGPERYDRIYHVTTLSLVQARGVPPLPAGAAATPNP